MQMRDFLSGLTGGVIVLAAMAVVTAITDSPRAADAAAGSNPMAAAPAPINELPRINWDHARVCLMANQQIHGLRYTKVTGEGSWISGRAWEVMGCAALFGIAEG